MTAKHSTVSNTPDLEVPWTWEKVPICLLYDIRRELRSLNAHLRCHNFVQIPTILRGIRRKLPTPPPRRKPAKRKRP